MDMFGEGESKFPQMAWGLEKLNSMLNDQLPENAVLEVLKSSAPESQLEQWRAWQLLIAYIGE